MICRKLIKGKKESFPIGQTLAISDVKKNDFMICGFGIN